MSEKTAYEKLDEMLKAAMADDAQPSDVDDFLAGEDEAVEADKTASGYGASNFGDSDADDDDEKGKKDKDEKKDKDDKDKMAGTKFASLGGMTMQEVLNHPVFNEAFARTLEKDAGFRAVCDRLASPIVAAVTQS